MDGGGLAINENGNVSAAWRRNGDVYYSIENQQEQKIGTGRDVSLAQNKQLTVIAWQENNRVKVMDLNKKNTLEVGNGVSPRVYLLADGKIICVWEDNKIVRYKLI